MNDESKVDLETEREKLIEIMKSNVSEDILVQIEQIASAIEQQEELEVTVSHTGAADAYET